ncbi:MFS general substrate transporter [Auricularia subglabra TFB-10046 SS5]|nr:MFS general substrate transporter [Auricularia subglabra TFB-10046 SS5]
MFTSFGLLNSFGALEGQQTPPERFATNAPFRGPDYFARIYLSNTSLFAIGWIASVQEFLIFATGLVIGIPFDRGYFYHIVMFGASLNTFSLFMLSLAQPQKFYQVRSVKLVGSGCILLPATAAIGQSFPRSGPLATGFAYTGASVGGIVMPLILNKLLYTDLGYSAAIKVLAGMLCALSFAGIALMRPRVLRPKSATQTAPPATVASMLAYAKEPEYVAVVIGCCRGTTVRGLDAKTVVVFYMQLNATQHGVRESVAFKVPTIINASAIPGRLLLNYISQRVGILNTMIFNTLACSAVMLSMLTIYDDSPTPFIVISIIYGFFSGAILSQINTALASEARTVHEIGTRTGVGFLFTGFAAPLCSPVIGWLLTKEYHWWKANTFGAVRGAHPDSYLGAYLLRLTVACNRPSSLVPRFSSALRGYSRSGD